MFAASATSSPFDPWDASKGPVGGQTAPYGSEGGDLITVLGLASLLYDSAIDDTAISFVQDPRAFPYLASLSVCQPHSKGKKSGKGCPASVFPLPKDARASHSLYADWLAEGYRLGGDTVPVVISQDLLVTNSDW